MDAEEMNYVSEEVDKLLNKGVLKVVDPVQDQWVSTFSYARNQMEVSGWF